MNPGRVSILATTASACFCTSPGWSAASRHCSTCGTSAIVRGGAAIGALCGCELAAGRAQAQVHAALCKSSILKRAGLIKAS